MHFSTSLKATYSFYLGFWKPLQERSLLGISKVCLWNKILSRPCKVQRSPAKHQRALERTKWGVKEGRRSAQVRAASAGFDLNCRYKVPVGTWHKVQVICSTASQSTLVLVHTHLCSVWRDTALPSPAVLPAGCQCPAGAGQASSCSVWNTAQCSQATLWTLQAGI